MIAYHPNGQINFQFLTVNGEEEGFFEGYYDNGVRVSEGNYQNGKEEGIWTYYMRMELLIKFLV